MVSAALHQGSTQLAANPHRAGRPLFLGVPLPPSLDRQVLRRRSRQCLSRRSPVPMAVSTLTPETSVTTAEGGDVGTHSVQVLLHHILDNDLLWRPRLEFQLVCAETGAMSDKIDISNWSRGTWPTGDNIEDKGLAYEGSIQLPIGFTPGVLLATKLSAQAHSQAPLHRDQLYMSSVTIGGVTFSCHSTVAIEQGERVFFSTEAKLPGQEDEVVQKYRLQELAALKGLEPDGKTDMPNRFAKRERTDRIYDYDVYNDLGDPAKSKDLLRNTLGGKDFPFPRRLRTGRPPVPGYPQCESDPPTSQGGLPGGMPWLPMDEQFDETKMTGFLGNELQAGLAMIPSKLAGFVHNNGNKDQFETMRAVDLMFEEIKGTSPAYTKPVEDILSEIRDKLNTDVKSFWTQFQDTKFPLPKVRLERELDWVTDEEFGRQMLAGQNPCVIYGATQEWMQGTGKAFNDSTVQKLLERHSFDELLKEGGRLFYVDYVPGFADYIDRVNNQAKEFTSTEWIKRKRHLHAARCLLYSRDDGYLVPVAIEVFRKKDGPSTVYTRQDTTELWRLVKFMFLSLDTGYHQLASHYLRAHACQEGFIIPFMRNISALHPVYKLMMPHFRYTLHINANARSILINNNGILEQTFTTGKYTMELASFVYGADWRFDQQAFPADLEKRNMLRRDPETAEILRDAKGNVTPVTDYPYADDGLQIWYALKDWFTAYLSLYYNDSDSKTSVAADAEVQAWWTEVQEKGHPDKGVGPAGGWPPITDIASLAEALLTIAFTGSAHHAAVNFGQYDYSAYSPNRPSIFRRPLPEKDSDEALKNNYHEEMFTYLPTPGDALQMVLLYKVLSAHAPNEEYLDNAQPEWIKDEAALAAHKKFLAAMQQVNEDVDRRNKLDGKMRSVVGSHGLPYTFLRPTPTPDVGGGVPCSTCI